MSKETIEWLNENTLIGFTDKRGHAWHYRAGSDNHFPGPVPVGEVQRRLFHWHPVKEPVYVRQGGEFVEVPDRSAVWRSDTGDVLGVFSDGYQPHDYNEWLLGAVSNIMGDTLAIGSAGMIKNGAVAWVQVEVPDTMVTPEGVQFRPNLLATTSLDGSVATTYKRTITNVVCDNTLSIGMIETDQTYRVRHTKNSGLRVQEARDALHIIHKAADDFADEIQKLTQIEISNRQWNNLLDELVPVPEERGRARTIAERKREELTQLWNADDRVSPWRNTAWGALAATNTWQHHMATVRGAKHRSERNFETVIKGRMEQSDQATLKALDKILGDRELVAA